MEVHSTILFFYLCLKLEWGATWVSGRVWQAEGTDSAEACGRNERGDGQNRGEPVAKTGQDGGSGQREGYRTREGPDYTGLCGPLEGVQNIF